MYVVIIIFIVLGLSSDYMVMSEFTLALFEDSGWYKANYTALHNLKQNSLQWGKGMYIFKLCITHLSKHSLQQTWDVIF